MVTDFAAKFSSNTKCPGCKNKIRIGDRCTFEHANYPWDTAGYGTRGVVWHSACVRVALVNNLCKVCHMLHKSDDLSHEMVRGIHEEKETQ